MVDYCSTKQISTFVLALIGFAVLVFFVEEYTEEHEMQSEMEMKRSFYNHENKDRSKVSPTKAYPIEDCWKHEKTELVSKCAPCKDFEIKAIKADHCLPTGHFDRINCLESNVTVLRSCLSPKETRKREFYIFSTFNFLILLVSYLVATQRKMTLDNQAYMRLPQHF